MGGIFAGVTSGILVGALGRYVRRGARIVGLGMADRIGGGAVGAAEGALVAMIVIMGAQRMFGTEHPVVFNSYSVAVAEELRVSFATGTVPQLPGLPSVAAAPPEGGN